MDLASKRVGKYTFHSYNGPPLFWLTPEVSRIIAKWPEHGAGYHLVQFEMSDGKVVNTAVAKCSVTELPAPYVPRDIRIVRKLA